LRILVTGGPPVRGGGMPQRINTISRSAPALRTIKSRIVRKHAGYRRQVAGIAVDDAEESEDGRLQGGQDWTPPKWRRGSFQQLIGNGTLGSRCMPLHGKRDCGSRELVRSGSRARKGAAVDNEILLPNRSAIKETLQNLERSSGIARLGGK
jgi:hypothetical protein